MNKAARKDPQYRVTDGKNLALSGVEYTTAGADHAWAGICRREGAALR